MNRRPLKCLVFFWMFSIFHLAANAQESLEEILSEAAEENAPDVAELVEAWRSTPIDPNRASRETLESFPLISRNLAGRILTERNEKPFSSFSDFITRLILDAETWQDLEPYFQIQTSRKRAADRLFEIRLRHDGDAPRSEGFRTHQYAGSPSKRYERIRFHPGRNIEAGILIEKDPGERDWADHRVGFVEFGTTDEKARFLFGNYRMETGQGLVFWGPYRLSQGADPLLPFTVRPGGARGYLTTDESASLFGVATEWNVGRLGGCLFYSKSDRDARIEDARIASLPTSGLHRTESEIDAKDKTKETLWGASFSVFSPFGRVGLAGYANAWDRGVSEPLERKHAIIGAQYDLGWSRFGSNGEIAFTKSGGAFITNQFLRTGNLEAVISLRAFSDRFNTPHGNAFCAKANSNEQGAYFGVRFDASSSQIAASFDLFRRPAPTSTLPLPSEGSVAILLFRKRLNQSNTISLLWKRKEETVMQEGSSVSGRIVSAMLPRLQNQIRIELVSKLASKLQLKTRVEWTNITVAEMCGEIESARFRENGFLMFEDIQLRLNQRWTFSVRWITFHTGSYESRIYVYEQDVPGAYALAPYYGKGNRQYLLLSCRPVKLLRLSLKYAETYHDRAEEWSSGLNQIEGDLEREWTIQADLEF